MIFLTIYLLFGIIAECFFIHIEGWKSYKNLFDTTFDAIGMIIVGVITWPICIWSYIKNR